MNVAVVISEMEKADIVKNVLNILNDGLSVSFFLRLCRFPENVTSLTLNFRGRDFVVTAFEDLIIDHNLIAVYDYILMGVTVAEEKICKEFLLATGVNLSKIINIYELLNIKWKIKSLMFRYATTAKIKFIAVGDATVNAGIRTDNIGVKSIKFAYERQDLYITYLYLKNLLHPNCGVRYVLIGLSPGSFRFDLSHAEDKWRILSWYPLFKDLHDLPIDNHVMQLLFNNKFTEFNSIDPPLINDILSEPEDDSYTSYGKKRAYGLRNKLEKDYGNNKKIHVEKNIKVFTECVKLCHARGIIPLVCILPMAIYYKLVFPRNILHEFYNLVYSAQENVPFKLFDFYSSDEDTTSFSSPEILNGHGMEKLSRKISAYIQKLESKKIKICFLVNTTHSWSKIVPLYEKMIESGKFECYLVIAPDDPNSAPGIVPSLEYGPEKDYYHKLYDDDSNMHIIDAIDINGEVIDMEDYQFDYVFYQRPYEYTFPEALQIKTVSRFAKTFHILYGFMVTENFVPFYYQFFGFYNCVDFYFTESERYAKDWQIVYNAEDGDQKFLFCGLPEIENEIKKNEPTILLNSQKRPSTILWTPRWSYHQVVGGSHFLEYKDKFVTLRRKYPNLKMITRPHPLLFNNMIKMGFMTEDDVRNYKEKLAFNNIELDEKPTYIDAIESADIMITDVTSIIINFFLTGKPMIYCPSYKPYGEFEDIVDSLYIANSWDDVEKYISMLLRGEDPLREKRLGVFNLLKKRHMGACERIIKVLEDDYNADMKKLMMR